MSPPVSGKSSTLHQQRSKAAAATAAEASAGETAATPAEAGASGAARGGGERCSCLGRKRIQIVHEAEGVKVRAKVATLIPLWRLGVDVGESFGPVFFHTEGHCVRQKFFKHLGRFNHAIEAVGFDVGEEVLEAEDTFERARAVGSTGGHKPAKAADDRGTYDSRNDEWRPGHTHTAADGSASPDGQKTDDDSGSDIGAAHGVGPMEVISAAHELGEDLILNCRDVLVEDVVEVFHFHDFLRLADAEYAVKQRLFVRLERGPFSAAFSKDEAVVLFFVEAHHAGLRAFLNDDIAADGEVHDGSGDVSHVGGIIDERADFARSKLVGWFVLRGYRSESRVAAVLVPDPIHDQSDENRYNKRPVAAEE